VYKYSSRVGESPANAIEAWTRIVSHDRRSACTERVHQADFMAYS
jgi:hypothetical protein